MATYAHPETLVETEWVAAHASDPGVRVVEVDVDTSAYGQGHVPGAIAWNWTTQLCDTVRRDIIPKDQFERLMAESGVGNRTTVILYGDNNTWFAAWAFWQMKLYGHEDVRVMNGGRKKWMAEERELTTEAPTIETVSYTARPGPLAAGASIRGDADVGGSEQRLRRCAQPGRVHGQDPCSAWAARDLPAWRPHPRGGEHSVGPGGQ